MATPPPPLLVRGDDGAVRWAAPTHDAASAPPGSHGGSGGPPAPGSYALARWEAEADAVYLLARAKLGRWNVDASRRVLEAAPRALSLRYYERWCFAVTTLLIETGVLSNEEVESRLAAAATPQQRGVPAGEAPRFAAGARVRVLCENPPGRWRTPHTRTPAYVQGQCGVVERCCGVFDAPEERAWHLTPVRQHLYRVAFPHAQLFTQQEQAEQEQQAAAAADAAVAEIFDRWLVPAEEDAEAAPSSSSSVYEPLLAVVKALLIEKGVLTQAEVDAHVAAQAVATAAGAALGGRLVAAAWCDAAFRARLLADAAAAAAEMGISTAGIAHLVVLENTEDTHNLVVCTLCSCYPRPILGPPPEWYRSWAYRQRAMQQPRQLLAEWGVALPHGTRVVVHDSTADCRYLVLPRRPRGTRGWEEAALAALVSTECLVGVAVLPPQGDAAGQGEAEAAEVEDDRA
jgi:nitrile hydratase